MFWIIVVIVIIIIGIGGSTLPSNGGPNGSGCDRCKNLPSYWRSLTTSQMVWMSVYTFWLWIDCKFKGC
jgi:hypothetical protein